MMNRDGQIGPYLILGPLNPSPKPRVHVARRESTRHADPALFVLEEFEDVGDPEWTRKQLITQATICAPLKDPRVLAARDVIEQNGEVYVVSDLIQGDTLRHLLQAGAKLPKMIAVALVREVASILTAARKLDLVHGDICPSTIMITLEGKIMLRELGLARAVTRTNNPIGHLGYMSPERATSRGECDHRSDVYSLGIVLWELLTGEKAICGINPAALRKAAMKPEIAKPTSLVKCGRELEEIVLRALAFDPDDRYAGTETLEKDLERYIVSRAPGTDLKGELAQLLPKHLGAKLRGQKSLVDRWQSRHPRPVSISQTLSPVRPVSSASLAAATSSANVSSDLAAQLFAEIDLAVQDLSQDIPLTTDDRPTRPQRGARETSRAKPTGSPSDSLPNAADPRDYALSTDDILNSPTGPLKAQPAPRRMRVVDMFFVSLLLIALAFALSTYVLTGAGDEVLEYWRGTLHHLLAGK